jgi:hypothetical protein
VTLGAAVPRFRFRPLLETAQSAVCAPEWFSPERSARGSLSLGPFWGTFDEKAAPRSGLRESKLVAMHVVSVVPRQGLDANRASPLMRATRGERIKHGAAVCRSTPIRNKEGQHLGCRPCFHTPPGTRTPNLLIKSQAGNRTRYDEM